jgi:acetyl esterase
MALKPDVESLLVLMAATGAPLEAGTPDEARANRKALARPSTTVVHEITDDLADDVPVRIYRPADGIRPGVLVWFHGGGWVLGDLDSHDEICREMANGSGLLVVSVDYRLAPEHPFPAPLLDCAAALRWVGDHLAELGVAGPIVIGGDSAGANLAAAVSHHPGAPLAGQVLIYPVADARMGSESYRTNAEGYFLTASAMRWFTDHYLSGGHGSPTDPRVSPLLADPALLAATPPAIVITAEYDPLRDEGEQYADALRAAGVEVTHTRYPGQIHAFFSLGDFLADGRRAVAQVNDWLRRVVA